MTDQVRLTVDGIESVRDIERWVGPMFSLVKEFDLSGAAQARMRCDQPMTDDEQLLWLRGRGPQDMEGELPC